MPEFKQYPAPMVFHQAMVDVVPLKSNSDLKFNFAVDGNGAGTEDIKGDGLTVAGKLLPLRIFPNPSQAGALIQVILLSAN